MSRAITGNLASSFVVSMRSPRSKPRIAALRATATAYGAHPAKSRRALRPAVTGQVVIEPRVEHQQRPQDLAMIAPTAHVRRGQPRDRRGVDETAATQPRQLRLRHVTEGAGAPGRQA